VYRIEHEGKTGVDLRIPEAQDAEPCLIQACVAQPITDRAPMPGVISTVQFNDNPSLQANEVDDVSRSWSLSSKLKSTSFPRAQMDPELHLLGRHVLAKVSSLLVSHR